MVKGSQEGRRWVMRARMDPLSQSAPMRDPVIFKYLEAAVGRKKWVPGRLFRSLTAARKSTPLMTLPAPSSTTVTA
jgi:hypothetical protein